MYHPFVIKLPKVDKDLDLKLSDVVESSIIPHPLFKLGFHHFIYRTRSAFGITKNLQTKTQFYYVVNPFETNILNYEDDISKLTKTYLKVKEEYPIDFYKIWETIFIFDLAKSKELDTLIISNHNAELVENAVKLFREKVIKGSKKQTFYTKEDSKLKKDSCDLIIANSRIMAEDENYMEQENYPTFFSEIIKILKYQKEGGNAIIEMNDSFTILTIKMIYIISSFFEETLVYKPFTSRHSDADRYIILKGFRSNKKIDSILKILETISKSMDTNKYVIDIFEDLVIPSEFLGVFKFINIRLVNNQQIMVNEIIKYIKENNYFGDKYHGFRDKQIESTQFWINNFYPPSETIYEKNKEDLGKVYKTIQEKLNLECSKFLELLI